MPLVTARIARERTLATLTRNLFVIEGPDAPEKQRLAEAALLRANPQLADRDAFQSGTVVLIPADIGLSRTDRVTTREEGPGGLLGEYEERLAQMRAIVQQELKAEATAARQYLAQIDEGGFREAILKAAPGDGERLLAEAKDNQSARMESAETRAATLATALDAAQADLKALLSRARPR